MEVLVWWSARMPPTWPREVTRAVTQASKETRLVGLLGLRRCSLGFSGLYGMEGGSLQLLAVLFPANTFSNVLRNQKALKGHIRTLRAL